LSENTDYVCKLNKALYGLKQALRAWYSTLDKYLQQAGFINGGVVGIGEDPGFNAQECTNKTLITGPFGNTCEVDEVSPEVESGVVARLRCDSWDIDL
jgi:hypothetical protein